MRQVFVDTAAWISLIDTDDQAHTTGTQLLEELVRQNVRFVTTEFVLLEVADGFCRPKNRAAAIAYLDGLRQMAWVRILPLRQRLLQQAWVLYCRRADKDWGLTDCTSFVVMEQNRITEAFTSDRHFEQAGFAKLM